jgi:hypothetical protein
MPNYQNHKTTQAKTSLADPFRALKNRALRTFGIAAALYNFGFFTLLAYAPFVMGLNELNGTKEIISRLVQSKYILFYTCFEINSVKASFGWKPITLSTTTPSLKRIKVGMLMTPNIYRGKEGNPSWIDLS